MYKVTFYTKHRNEIEFECNKIDISTNGFGELINYSIDFGVSENKIMYIETKDIECITIKENY